MRRSSAQNRNASSKGSQKRPLDPHMKVEQCHSKNPLNLKGIWNSQYIQLTHRPWAPASQNSFHVKLKGALVVEMLARGLFGRSSLNSDCVKVFHNAPRWEPLRKSRLLYILFNEFKKSLGNHSCSLLSPTCGNGALSLCSRVRSCEHALEEGVMRARSGR